MRAVESVARAAALRTAASSRSACRVGSFARRRFGARLRSAAGVGVTARTAAAGVRVARPDRLAGGALALLDLELPRLA